MGNHRIVSQHRRPNIHDAAKHVQSQLVTGKLASTPGEARRPAAAAYQQLLSDTGVRYATTGAPPSFAMYATIDVPSQQHPSNYTPAKRAAITGSPALPALSAGARSAIGARHLAINGLIRDDALSGRAQTRIGDVKNEKRAAPRRY